LALLATAPWATVSWAAAAQPAAARAESAPAAPAAAPSPEPMTADYRKGLEALRAGRIDKAEQTAMSMLNAQPQQPRGRQLLGLVKVKRGDLPGAIGEFDKALTSDPQFIPAREERAVALARMGRSEKARGDLEVLKSRAAACAKTCPPELRTAVSRVEAALAAGRPAAAVSAAAGPVAHAAAAAASF
jgi:predicted Zn-dependent protease